MLFNSIDFAIFLPVIFIMYWFVFNKNLTYQNILLLVASYIFYGWWDWRFLSLIFVSTLIDFFIGIKLNNEENKKNRKILLSISLIVNLGFLFFFKYYNFFIDNFIGAFSFVGIEFNANSLNIILPVGISFYTFQTLSYTIDVYRKKLNPTKNFIAFSAFVSFFPQLVAGPIERATNLLPQFYNDRSFKYEKAVDGLRQILWGLFKKMVVADNCAVYANMIFNDSANSSGSTLLLGAFFFSFQIYGDFSGYSDIAIGTSKLFGFNLMKNFSYPYFSRDIAEFWRRWHISLSSWFRDYLYIPLGGSKGGNWMKIRNTFIIFIVSGFWHGANWTFIIWGLLNAIYFLPLQLLKQNRKNLDVVSEGKLIPSFNDFFSMMTTFCLTLFAWIFFRSNNINHAIQYISGIFSYDFFSIPMIHEIKYSLYDVRYSLIVVIFIFILLIVEWLGRANLHPLQKIKFNKLFRWLIYSLIIFSIFMFTPTNESPFIYFQF